VKETQSNSRSRPMRRDQKQCPFPRCPRVIHIHNDFCSEHWFGLPAALRSRMTKARCDSRLDDLRSLEKAGVEFLKIPKGVNGTEWLHKHGHLLRGPI
jgi:hypothetical protein